MNIEKLTGSIWIDFQTLIGGGLLIWQMDEETGDYEPYLYQ